MARITLDISEEIKKEVQEQAKKQGLNMASWIRQLIIKKLNEIKEK